MSSGDLNWIPAVETVTNLQPLKNVRKRSWLSDYSNFWDSGLSGRSLAVNGRCSNSEWLERYRLYCVHCVCVAGISVYCMLVSVVDYVSKFQRTRKVVSVCLFSGTSKCSVFGNEDVEELRSEKERGFDLKPSLYETLCKNIKRCKHPKLTDRECPIYCSIRKQKQMKKHLHHSDNTYDALWKLSANKAKYNQ